MLEIERGKAKPYEGNYTQYLEQKQREIDVQRAQNARTEKVLARELEWIRRTLPRARSSPRRA